jgi:hypothetical protein
VVAESDVDLLIIGNLTLAKIAPTLKKLEKRIGRPINPSTYPRYEFAAKMRAGNHFVRTVCAGKKLFLLGDPREFAIAFTVEKTPPAQDQPRRA